jgi:hypothetical protein
MFVVIGILCHGDRDEQQSGGYRAGSTQEFQDGAFLASGSGGATGRYGTE